MIAGDERLSVAERRASSRRWPRDGRLPGGREGGVAFGAFIAQDSRPLGRAMNRIRHRCLGVPAGRKVRFDGQHKRNGFLVDELGPLVEWVPVCPEVEVGMGVPREPVRLVAHRDGPRMVGLTSGSRLDRTHEPLADARARALAREELSGFVLKSRSPSCGMERVKLYPDAETRRPINARGTGLFAAALARRLPNLPIEEEGRLEDARLRESFIERVFAYARLQALWRGALDAGRPGGVPHRPQDGAARALHRGLPGARAPGRGGQVAAARDPARALRGGVHGGAGEADLAGAPRQRAHPSARAHKDVLDDGDKRELLDLIEAHRRGRLPLVVPLTLLAHHARRLRATYLLGQTYLGPRSRGATSPQSRLTAVTTCPSGRSSRAAAPWEAPA